MSKEQHEDYIQARRRKKIEEIKQTIKKEAESDERPLAESYKEAVHEIATKSAEADANAKDELLPGVHVVWSHDLRRMDLPPPDWTVERLISKRGINAISGVPGSHKTFFTMDIAIAVSRGSLFLGTFPTKRCKALIIDEESGLARLKERERLLADEDLDIAYVSLEQLKIDRPGIAERIIEYCKLHDIGVVIFDSLSCFSNVNENDNAAMSGVFEHFQRIVNAGITVIIIHHEPKGSDLNPDNASPRGASAILAKCDVHISIRHKSRDDENTLIVKQLKNRDAERLPAFEVAVLREGDTRTWFEYVGEAPKSVAQSEINAEVMDTDIADLLMEQGEMHQGAIIDAFKGKYGQKAIGKRLEALVTEKSLESDTRAHGRKYYWLKTGDSDE